MNREEQISVERFFNFRIRRAEAQAARERYDGSCTALELAKVNERAAELASQHEPLNTLTNVNREERERILQAINFVVYDQAINSND